MPPKPKRPASTTAVAVRAARDAARDLTCSGLPGGLPATAYRYELSERCRLIDRPALAARAQQAALRRQQAATESALDRADHRALERALAREYGGRAPPAAELNTPTNPANNSYAVQRMLDRNMRVKFPDPLRRFLEIQQAMARAVGAAAGAISRYLVLSDTFTALAHALRIKIVGARGVATTTTKNVSRSRSA